MSVKRYARRDRGANAAPYTWPTRRKRPPETDWARLVSGDRVVGSRTVAAEQGQGYVVAISLNMNRPTRSEVAMHRERPQ